MGSEADHRLAPGPAGGRMERAVDLAIRLGRAWQALTRERRRAAGAAVGLFLTLFLPWYQDTLAASHAGRRHALAATSQTVSVSGWGAFSFVEAAVLILALAVLVVLFREAEGRTPHLPGGAATAITGAGALSCVLVVWRIFDHSGTTTKGLYVLSTGVDWGIFVALLVSAGLTYAGTRIRAAGRSDPHLPTDGAVFDGRWREPTKAERAGTPREPAPAPSAPRHQRSPWRPGERPEWRDAERPVGWLTAPPKWSQREE